MLAHKLEAAAGFMEIPLDIRAMHIPCYVQVMTPGGLLCKIFFPGLCAVFLHYSAPFRNPHRT